MPIQGLSRALRAILGAGGGAGEGPGRLGSPSIDVERQGGRSRTLSVGPEDDEVLRSPRARGGFVHGDSFLRRQADVRAEGARGGAPEAAGGEGAGGAAWGARGPMPGPEARLRAVGNDGPSGSDPPAGDPGSPGWGGAALTLDVRDARPRRVLGFPKYTERSAGEAARPRPKLTAAMVLRPLAAVAALFAGSCLLVGMAARALPSYEELPAGAVLRLEVAVARVDGLLAPEAGGGEGPGADGGGRLVAAGAAGAAGGGGAGDGPGARVVESDAALMGGLAPEERARVASRARDLCRRGSLLRVPRGLAEAKEMQAVLDTMQGAAPARTMLFFVSFYLAMQSFMIPGVLFLNPMAGSMLPFWRALALVQSCSVLGSCAAYWLSGHLLADVAHAAWSDKLARFRAAVARHRADLLNYLVALRLSPAAPNFFINLSSPIAGVPFRTYAAATFVGLFPGNLLLVNAGSTIASIRRVRDLYSPSVVAGMLVMVGASVLPVLYRRWKPARAM